MEAAADNSTSDNNETTSIGAAISDTDVVASSKTEEIKKDENIDVAVNSTRDEADNPPNNASQLSIASTDNAESVLPASRPEEGIETKEINKDESNNSNNNNNEMRGADEDNTVQSIASTNAASDAKMEIEPTPEIKNAATDMKDENQYAEVKSKDNEIGASQAYNIDDFVYCFSFEKLYLSRVMNINKEGNETKYHIHYHGWSAIVSSLYYHHYYCI